MMKLHGDYAQYFNYDTHRVGHVFGERFQNKVVVPNTYGLWLTCYIHRQAVAAGLVSDPMDYPWTSYRIYIGLDKKWFIKPEIILNQFGTSQDAHQRYKEFVLEEVDEPVDWTKKAIKIVNMKSLIEMACKELHIEKTILYNPRGWAEKKRRHEVVRILMEKYCLPARQIADFLGLSRMAITKIVGSRG